MAKEPKVKEIVSIKKGMIFEVCEKPKTTEIKQQIPHHGFGEVSSIEVVDVLKSCLSDTLNVIGVIWLPHAYKGSPVIFVSRAQLYDEVNRGIIKVDVLETLRNMEMIQSEHIEYVVSIEKKGVTCRKIINARKEKK